MQKKIKIKMTKGKNKNIVEILSNWLPVFLWASFIFFLSSLPQQHASQVYLVDFVIKKSAHIFEYAVLYSLIYRATERNLILSLILAIIYAATDEFHQSFVPDRTARLYDVFGFDLVGASATAFLIWKLKQLRRAKH